MANQTVSQDATIQRLLGEAMAAGQRGDDREELRLIEAALKIAPADPRLLNARGMWSLRHAAPGDAAGYFHRAAMLDPGEPALWMNLASARRAEGDDAGELESLERALSCDQRHLMALLRKAELHERRGEDVFATMAWEAVLALTAGAEDIPPALVERLTVARAFVASQRQQLGESVDEVLAAARAALSSEDRRRVDACIDAALGRRRIYTNECAGVHFPFLPADEFFARAHFPWMDALEAQTPAILAELEALIADGEEGLRPYVAQAPGTPENKWSALDGKLDWGARFLWEYGARNEPLCARCPNTVSALEAVPQTQIPGRAPTAFFSFLKPHTRIPPHTGVTNTRTIIHLPLIVPPGCGFRVGGERREWVVGKAFGFDDTIEHEAWNDSDQLRAVLIFDVWNPYMTEAERGMMRQFFEIADERQR